MCGRYTIRRLDAILLQLGLSRAQWQDFKPRYNVAPSQDVPIIRAKDGSVDLTMMSWGFVPSWTRDLAAAKLKPINARSEGIDKSRMFARAVASRRCIVPADGFFEWQKLDSRRKQPFFIHRSDDGPLLFAGIWERWKQGDEPPLETFAILTAGPNKLMEPIHNRMPVVLPQSAVRQWLDETVPFSSLSGLVSTTEWTDVKTDPVSTHVNSPRHDDPQCVVNARVTEEKGLFGSL